MDLDDRIQPLTRTQMVTGRLREEILSGAMPAGSRIRQAEVAKRLGVSTTPVREALSTLEREGLVVLDAYRGAGVLPISVDDLRENFAIRTSLEALAAEYCANRATTDDVADLQVLIRKMDDADSPETYFQLNRDFHARMYLAAGMPRLSEVINQFRDAADVYLRLAAASDERVRPNIEVTRREHVELVEAISARKSKLAARLMKAHIQTLGDRLVDHFEHLRTDQ